jgi:hypothetical protein
MKPKTIGYYKNVQNVGTCKATAELKLGMGVILDRAAKTASLPASDAEAKACHRIVTNINDKPEMHNYPETVVVAKGDYVRADDLTSVANMEMEFAHYEIKDGDYDGLAKGDKLVFGTDGLIAKTADATGYKVYFEFVEKTAYMGKGALLVIRVQ